MSRTPQTFFLILPLIASPQVHAAQFIGLRDWLPGQSSSEALAVSADGTTVVGSGSSQSGYQLFRWTLQEGTTLLGTPQGGSGKPVANAVSGDGSVVVGVYGSRAFRWTREDGLGILTPYFSRANGVSTDGSIITGAVADATWPKTFRWSQTQGMTQLEGLSSIWQHEGSAVSGDSSTIVGYSVVSPSRTDPTYWRGADGPVSLALISDDFSDGFASQVSNDGTVIVGSNVRRGVPLETRFFRWTQETGTVALADIPEGATLEGMTADGLTLVGGTGVSAFIWDTTHGCRNLSALLTSGYGLDLTDWHLYRASGISADGNVIVGAGGHLANGVYQTEAWVAILPEPSGLLGLMAAWMLVILVRGRRLDHQRLSL